MKEGQDVVLEWDVREGGLMGALIVCRACAGTGHALEFHDPPRACETCSGDGRLHRPYQMPEATGPAPAAYLAPRVQTSTVDALEAAIRLMDQRSQVLRKVLDQERERVKREALSAQIVEWGAAAQRGLLAGYGLTGEAQVKTGDDGELLIASGLGRPVGEWRGVTWPMRSDDEGDKG